jgi:hypothetical protein
VKRVIVAAFCISALCLLLILTETVKAPPKPGYSVTDHQLTTTPTLDGQWTNSGEWDDCQEKELEGDLDGIFRLKFEGANYPTSINQYWLIEFFNDTTTDGGDYFQICYASGATVNTDPVGGTAPQTDCLKFEHIGHNSSSMTVYKGTGTAWGPGPAWTWPADIQVVGSVSSSPLEANPHWIYEIKIEHIHFNIQPNFWIYVAVYDASASSTIQSWPPGSSDVPNDWGLMTADNNPIPESLTIGALVFLSSVAVVCSFYLLRKRPQGQSSPKLEETNQASR